jgi:hypothetical protein
MSKMPFQATPISARSGFTRVVLFESQLIPESPMLSWSLDVPGYVTADGWWMVVVGCKAYTM